MKLFSKLYRLNLLATVIIFVCASCAYYLLVRYIIIEQFDSSLHIERVEIENYALTNRKLPRIIPVKDQVTSFQKAHSYEKFFVETVAAFDTVGRDTADFRKLHFSIRAGDQWYRAVIGKSMEGTEHLIQSIIVISLGAILLILLVSSAINRYVLKSLWTPFYNGLQFMKDYEVGKKTGFVFPKTNTEEFEFMNEVLRQATGKADRDYLALKDFTENASHEMQTPLAIIRSKMDLIIQDEQISLSHGRNLQTIYQAINKLTLLNQSLLLLTKISNSQFAKQDSINIAEIIEEKLYQFEQIFNDREISITRDIRPFTVSMNKDLLDALLNNLLSNAVKHNRRHGLINLFTTEGKTLKIGNTGKTDPLDQKKVFSRFYKPNETSQTGLGLSIIKEICTVSGCNISYHYEEGRHFFIIEWT